ncbi:hypothetical protein A2870_03000 [Candidatus Curtissbacteria bacterium RIFCSPHIGHO2_01_FULL_41_11]|uniref:UPF0102 protein A2870_03000 n=1 Tax=Candidatus Curtissbacteria bacterium RIFCSPHIGHO2_01_FULL_41_11 TaxID=1797711 RepID=A0A1F5G6W2_9BACT|nr:MAG: hypothetical protein A2870_03000 [Candidatus Curtissbacteria bacterium RIFCSPHIGHO2_01_FULL_41_11]
MTQSLGKYGEDLAANFLNTHGYKILERNFRIRGGEIDIIALEKNVLVYIEVKTRTSHKFGLPQEAITPHKIKFLERSAKFYRNARQNLPLAERIDVVTVDLTSGKPVVELIKNASF